MFPPYVVLVPSNSDDIIPSSHVSEQVCTFLVVFVSSLLQLLLAFLASTGPLGSNRVESGDHFSSSPLDVSSSSS